MQTLSHLLNHWDRAYRLRGFWQRRTTFYRDLATALDERELPNDFIAGELAIALTPQTHDTHRARGLAFLRDVMHSSDISLHQALMAAMPKADTIALATLRYTQQVPQALRDLASNLDQQAEMSRMVRGALVSPLVLMPVAYVFAYVLSSVSIPEFSKAAPPEVWTPFNAAVRFSAGLFQAWSGYAVTALALSLLWVFVWALPNWTAPWRYTLESARGVRRMAWILGFPFQPIFELYRDIQGAKMLANLANLMQSGMLLQDAVAVLSDGAQPWMRRHLAMVSEHLQLLPGDHVGAFSHGILSTFLLSRLSSMVRRDAGGQFDKVLIALGTTGLQDAKAAVQARAVAINAVLLCLTFSVIAFFYAGQNSIAYAIQDANSPAAVMRRQLQKQSEPALPSGSKPHKGASLQGPVSARHGSSRQGETTPNVVDAVNTKFA
jgi:hypothetical protein